MYRVLNKREDNEKAVTIRWDTNQNEISLVFIDKIHGITWTENIPSDKAMDAFDHPYLYVCAA